MRNYFFKLNRDFKPSRFNFISLPGFGQQPVPVPGVVELIVFGQLAKTLIR